MIYLIGGAPRAGKTILGQRLCTTLKVGWVSTDLLMELLRVANAAGRKMKWDAAPEAITANAEWFFPYLERFIWGVCSFADHYVIEGVDFLPAQVVQLSTQVSDTHGVFGMLSSDARGSHSIPRTFEGVCQSARGTTPSDC